jgi:Tol biopolymer transport system component
MPLTALLLAGLVIALSSCGDADYRSRLIIFDPGDPGTAQVVVRDIASLENPVWSPDGRWLAALGGTPEETAIVVIDPTTGSIVRRALRTLVPRGRSVTWSPDSKSLATVYLDPAKQRSAVVVVVDTTTWEEREVASFTSRSSVTAGSPEVAWSPDGSTIAVTAGVGLGSSDIAFVDPITGNVTGPIDLPGYQFALTWLNDKTLGFGSVVDDGIAIQTLDSPSGRPATVAADFNTFAVAAASPDGTMIGVVSRIGTPSGLSLYRVATETWDVATLVPVVSSLVLAWSPDSMSIAVPMNREVAIVPADGAGETRKVFKVGGKEEIRGLAWSPDRSQIAISVRQRPPSD